MRPVVLIASTHPATSAALREVLGRRCRDLGLKLSVCPGGDEIEDYKTRIYDGSRGLFDYLEQCPPEALADTLVVLCLGNGELEGAFAPNVAVGAWGGTGCGPGVAVELLTRFPLIFPVFFSPDAPLMPSAAVMENSTSAVIDSKNPANSRQAEESWARIREGIFPSEMRTKGGAGEPVAFFNDGVLRLHFASPLDDKLATLLSTLARFAGGMRCWFDPTGLRSLVKSRWLAEVFGSPGQSSKLPMGVDRILSRLGKVCVAVDEEREFASFSAYAGWKFGRRSWLVTSYAEFGEHPLWGRTHQAKECDVVILRDIDLRFPDINPTAHGVRARLADLENEDWKKLLDSRWLVRVISGETTVRSVNSPWERLWVYWLRSRQSGQWKRREKRRYLGIRKPASTFYDLRRCLSTSADGESFLARLLEVRSREEPTPFVTHGAPYSNLEIAESLLRQVRMDVGRSGEGAILRALLASEAYELLLGMSKSTALRALQEMHRAEVQAEVSYPGVGEALDIRQRKRDLEDTATRLYRRSPSSMRRLVVDVFLGQVWADLRGIYRSGERFAAAESSNRESLVRTPWLPPWLKGISRILGLLSLTSRHPVKFALTQAATSLFGWGVAASILVAGATAGYAVSSGGVAEYGRHEVARLALDTLMTSLALEPQGAVERILTGQECSTYSLFVYAGHIAISYILFSLLVAMLYRKAVRG